jgi:Fe-S cluster assembly ATP-binding protein
MPNPLLKLSHLTVKTADKTILNDLSLAVESGSFHVVLGPNGSGKSTLASFLAGHPDYVAESDSQVEFAGQDLLALSADERSKAGLFLAFQQPVAVPGLRVLNFLWLAYQQLFPELADREFKTIVLFRNHLRTLAKTLDVNTELLERGLNEGFSGGEKKRLEILQLLVLKPKLAILDEIDSGLDVDALKVVAEGITRLRKEVGTAIILITHHQRIVRSFKPDVVEVLVAGKLVASGDITLLEQIEQHGFGKFKAAVA